MWCFCIICLQFTHDKVKEENLKLNDCHCHQWVTFGDWSLITHNHLLRTVRNSCMWGKAQWRSASLSSFFSFFRKSEKHWKRSKNRTITKRVERYTKAGLVFVTWLTFGPPVVSFTKDSSGFVTTLTQVTHRRIWRSGYKSLLCDTNGLTRALLKGLNSSKMCLWFVCMFYFVVLFGLLLPVFNSRANFRSDTGKQSRYFLLWKSGHLPHLVRPMQLTRT